MPTPPKPGKSEMLARRLDALRLPALLPALPQQNSLIVFNYHRIGDPAATRYDSGVFSATADEFEAEMEYVARRLKHVTLAEAVEWIENGGPPQARVLITFDDGYRDNYDLAVPILKRFGIQGVFFLPTGFVGAQEIPWWDAIASMVRRTARRSFTLSYPRPLAVSIDEAGVEHACMLVIESFKIPEMTDEPRFFRELEEATGTPREEPSPERLFMTWDEARRLRDAGMAIGAHTHTHRILGRLREDEQRTELVTGREILARQLGAIPDTLAYPVGSPTAFTSTTKQLAQETGYRAAFSYYGGINRPQATDRFDVRRLAIGGESPERFRVRAACTAFAGRFWP